MRDVGTVHSIDDRRSARRKQAARSVPVEFFFALGCPLSYLLAERIERELGEVAWVPVDGSPAASSRETGLVLAQARAARLPLVEPDGDRDALRAATRVAVWAAARGAGRQFGLAALRLEFCGGYDLSTRRALSAAADAAGLPVCEALRASQDPEHDRAADRASARMRAGGAPLVRIGEDWYPGRDALLESAAFTAALARARQYNATG